MKNIFLIPTQEESNLYVYNNKLIFAGYVTTRKHLAIDNRFIYITDDSEIKTNDYYINYSNKPYVNCSGSTKFEGLYDNCSKIIATNDLGLIHTGVQQLTKEQLQEYVINPVDSVEVKSIYTRVEGYITSQFSHFSLVFSPKIDDNSPEKLAESFVRDHKDFETESFSDYHNGLFNSFIEGYNSPKKELKTEGLYTKEDLKEAYSVGIGFCNGAEPATKEEIKYNFKKWFKLFENHKNN